MGQQDTLEILDKRIELHLRNVAEKINISNPKFCVSKASKVGDNFIGVVYRATIEGEKNGKEDRVYCIFKCTPEKEISKVLGLRVVFLREIFFYEEVLPTFNEMLSKYDMSLKYFPTLYYSCKDEDNEVLILEDMRPQNFTMKSTKVMDYAHVCLTLRALGQFHAYSFATRVKNPEAFKKLQSMEEPLFYERPDVKLMDQRMQLLCMIIEKALADEKDHYLQRFKSFVNDLQNVLKDVINGANAEPYAVVNHGDLWTNNLLFKYKEAGVMRELQDLRFLDFQLSRYASPALDISYLLFCSCPYELRAQYFDELLRHYHDSLSECLERLECDAKVLFPYEILLEHMKRFAKFGAVMGIFVLHLFTDNEKQFTELTMSLDKEVLEKRLEKDEFYRTTLKNTYKDFIDRNYI